MELLHRNDRMKDLNFKPIGILKTCFKEKFGIPRQPRLIDGAIGILKLNDDFRLRNAIREIKGFSHLWIIFVFHQHQAKNWKPSIRPPRLGGARKVGVLASRSPHRPNPIGLSAVKLDGVDLNALGGAELFLSGLDILDGTPVLDIKPYIPYADSISNALSGWANDPIEYTRVTFSDNALKSIEGKKVLDYPHLKDLITGMLELDPRPAFQKRSMPTSSPESEGTQYGFRLFDFDVKWEIRDSSFHIVDIVDFL